MVQGLLWRSSRLNRDSCDLGIGLDWGKLSESRITRITQISRILGIWVYRRFSSGEQV